MAIKNNRMLLIDEESLQKLFTEIRIYELSYALDYKDKELERPIKDDRDYPNFGLYNKEVSRYEDIIRYVSKYEELIKPFIVNNEDNK